MAGVVGSQLGRTYQSAEGKGEAFILPDTNVGTMSALEEMRRAQARYDEERKANLKQQQLKQAATQVQMQALPKTNFWHVHNQEKQEGMDKIRNWAIELMGAGINDPFTSPQAGEFQKEVANFISMSDYSKGLEDQYNKAYALVNTDSSKYDKESVDRLMDFYNEGDLKTKIEVNAKPPRLYRRDADFEIATKMNNLLSGMNNAATEKHPDDLNAVAKMAFSSDDAPEWEESTSKYLDRLTPEQREIISNQAAAQDLTNNEYVLKKWMEPRYGVAKYDLDKFVDNIDVATATTTISEGDVMTSSVRVNDKSLKEHISIALKLNPVAYRAGVEQGRWTSVEDAEEKIFSLRKSGTSTSFKRTLDKTAYEEKNGIYTIGKWKGKAADMEVNFNQWRDDFRSKEPNASGFIIGAKDPSGGTITKVDFGDPELGQAPHSFTLSAGLKEVEDPMGNKSYQEQTVPKQFSLDKISDEELRKLYMQGIESRGGLYGDSRNEVYIPGSTPPAATPTTTSPGFYMPE